MQVRGWLWPGCLNRATVAMRWYGIGGCSLEYSAGGRILGAPGAGALAALFFKLWPWGMPDSADGSYLRVAWAKGVGRQTKACNQMDALR